MKKIMVILAAILTIALTGCAASPASEKTETASSEPADIRKEDLNGTWKEKYDSEMGMVISEKGEDQYLVTIGDGSAEEGMHTWTFTAKPGDGSTLVYSDCVHTVTTSKKDLTQTEETVYEDGTGTIMLLSTNELMWKDNIDDAGADIVFVHII